MGSFSHRCKLTNLPIICGDPVALVIMKPVKNLFEYSEKTLNKYGSTYMCSNDGPRLKFIPCWFPLIGEYNDYGGIENIVEDDNTKIIEEYFGLPIATIADIITSNRKDDGYDEVLKEIMVEPDKYEYGNPVYQERYKKELLSLSGMWIHGEFYEKITNDKRTESFGNKLDFGTFELLESLGFEQLPKDKSRKRFNIPFKHGNLVVYSDGTWLDGNIYSIKDIRKLAKNVGEEIDFSPIKGKDLLEQIYDLLMPKTDIPERVKIPVVITKTDEELLADLDKFNEIFKENDSLRMTLKTYKNLITSENMTLSKRGKYDEKILYYFMNTASGHSAKY